jgi:hypothetical protein
MVLQFLRLAAKIEIKTRFLQTVRSPHPLNPNPIANLSNRPSPNRIMPPEKSRAEIRIAFRFKSLLEENQNKFIFARSHKMLMTNIFLEIKT